MKLMKEVESLKVCSVRIFAFVRGLENCPWYETLAYVNENRKVFFELEFTEQMPLNNCYPRGFI